MRGQQLNLLQSLALEEDSSQGRQERQLSKTKHKEVKERELNDLKNIVESLLFATQEPLSFQKIRNIISTFYPIKVPELRAIIQQLQTEYILQQKSFRLEAIAQGYVLRTRPEYHSYIAQLFKNSRSEKLSQAALETLAIIAYKQPITRVQIESVRGVDCSGVIVHLQDRELVEPVGKLEAPGRPTLYGTTKQFLKHFGLNDIQELPPIFSFKEKNQSEEVSG